MCKISGCANPAIAQGLCAKHYMRQRRTGDPTVKRRPGPKSRPNSENSSTTADAPSQELLTLRREVAALRRKVRALERQAAAKPKRAAATARVSGRRVREASASDPSDESAKAPLTNLSEVNFDNLKFVFAKTLPQNPHWYVKRTPQNEKDFVALFGAIQKFGRVEKWRGIPYRYWYRGDGYRYWAMTSEIRQSWVINRGKVP